jgi:hypothetical protein
MPGKDAARPAPAATGREPRMSDRAGCAIGIPNSTAHHRPAIADNTPHPRSWWQREARRVGSDWPGVLALHAAVVAAWRARHDHQDTSS